MNKTSLEQVFIEWKWTEEDDLRCHAVAHVEHQTATAKRLHRFTSPGTLISADVDESFRQEIGNDELQDLRDVLTAFHVEHEDDWDQWVRYALAPETEPTPEAKRKQERDNP